MSSFYYWAGVATVASFTAVAYFVASAAVASVADFVAVVAVANFTDKSNWCQNQEILYIG